MPLGSGEMLPFMPGERVIVDKLGDFYHQVGRVDAINLQNGEVRVYMQSTKTMETFHIDELEKLA